MNPVLSSKEMEGAIFEMAIGLEDLQDREIFLERWFRDDAAGLKQMRELLHSHREASSFFLKAREVRASVASELLEEITRGFDPPPPGTLQQTEVPGTMIGRYRLIKRIGEGGGGVVYEAEQEVPMRRRVAIKIIRLGMDTEGVIARFEIERQALALMDHPNIARVLDAGATSTGRPFFVMELVDGEKLTTCCDRQGLSNRERLALFIQVCHAIQHAHQKGIIHRDIKPSNILVTHHDGFPVPKVIDFGIAKATDPRLGRQHGVTSHDQLIGTPAYMSPEQIDMVGLDVDTRSDVYSLGVLLYELLTSRTPFDGEDLVNAGISEMRRTLLTANHPLPSQMLTATPKEALAEIAANRRVEVPRLISFVRGDLDWIVMRAMEKNRNRRYQTVNALASDVQRFLDNQPVTARPPGKFYLIGKFVRRNRVSVASAAAVAISLVAGLGAATTLYLRERHALVEQARLSRVAEASRNEEARLRHKAQARENVSRVALLLNEGQIVEADALLHENPLVSIEPSPEAASVFRSLGNWNATYQRWDQAATCFLLLNQANRFEKPLRIVEGSDLLSTAPALLQLGETGPYEEFRRDALDRYLPVNSSFQAEHMIKTCLLLPATPSVIRRLGPAAELCEKNLRGTPRPGTHPTWEAFSLALYRLRSGNPEGALDCHQTAIRFPMKEACKASFYCIDAIANHKTGEYEKAKLDLETAERIIAACTDANIDFGDQKPAKPDWFDLCVAKLLFEEARKEIAAK